MSELLEYIEEGDKKAMVALFKASSIVQRRALLSDNDYAAFKKALNSEDNWIISELLRQAQALGKGLDSTLLDLVEDKSYRHRLKSMLNIHVKTENTARETQEELQKIFGRDCASIISAYTPNSSFFTPEPPKKRALVRAMDAIQTWFFRQ